jgi:flavin-dependent thymidylate synthase
VARQEVEKARKSNSAIIFKMGHHSIAEHAVFNFDIIGVSRLALEEIEKFRLCAYTEKSQRYQKLEDEFIVPDEVRAAGLEKDFVATINQQNQFYQEMVEKGIEPEDARYITALATKGQVGHTINARNLEFLFRRFSSHPMREVQQIGKEMYALVNPIAPSIILFPNANDFDQKTYPDLRNICTSYCAARAARGSEVELIDYTADADNKLITSLLHSCTNLSYGECQENVGNMTDNDKKQIIKTCCKYAEFYDRPQREFEYVDLTYDLIVSAACFGQLKRHRMATITSQLYDPKLGIKIPPAIKKQGLEDKFNQVIKFTDKTYEKIKQKDQYAAQYVLTNAHRKRVLIKVNARELYHMSRLREDQHAQWDIREITAEMTRRAKEVMPLAMLFVGGKDSYADVYEACFGKKPKVMPQY